MPMGLGIQLRPPKKTVLAVLSLITLLLRRLFVILKFKGVICVNLEVHYKLVCMGYAYSSTRI